MTYLNIIGWSGAIAALVCVPISSARASHCEYCNAGLPSAVSIKTLEIGTDGVIVVVLEDARDRVLDSRFWDITTVTVTDSSATAIEGALEVHPGYSPAAWRPMSPWVPGTYEVTVEVDRSSLESPDEPMCLGFSVTESVVVVDEARHVVGDQLVSVAETEKIDSHYELGTLVCCDGALPRVESIDQGYWCPGYPSSQLNYGGGHCRSLEGRGELVLAAQLLIDGEAAEADYSMREVTREETSTSGDALVHTTIVSPACLEYEVLDLVSGDRSLHSSCHGDEVADSFGVQPLDPTAELASECTSIAYVCEVEDNAWNRDACISWPDGDPYEHPPLMPDVGEGEPEEPAVPGADAADGCRVGTPSPGTLPWLVSLLWLTRRRRDRM